MANTKTYSERRLKMGTMMMAEATALTTAFTTAITAIQSDAMGTITVALPIALGIAGTFIAIKLGMKFFKSVAK